MPPPDSPYDVAIVGGALAGSATACLLLRRRPGLRIVILERSEQLKRRVGESTVEISGFFLGRVLGLTEHLLEHHLPKQGMRFWAANESTESIDRCSELGPGYNVRMPGYQVDRAVLDEHLLAQAAAEGAEVRRPVKVKSIGLAAGGLQTIEFDDGAAPLQARWVVDASGVAAVLARQEGWWRTNAEHPTAACWSRWSGVKSWDGREMWDRHPEWALRCRALRSVATNHLTGYGWWAWWIPLKGGDVSIGIVYDQRLVSLPPGPSVAERLRAFLMRHPAARELMADAQYREGDVHLRTNLAYSSTTFATDGAVLVGDAAGFLDPFYSPGMEWISFSASAAAGLIDRALGGEPAAPLVDAHNRKFRLAYDRWFRGLYKDKYFYLGDHDLFVTAFRLDLGMYYLGSVMHVFRTGPEALETPGFGRPYAGLPAAFMALYNRRLAAMARSRRARGVWGRSNAGRYFAFTSYEINRRVFPRVIAATLAWLLLEVREGWRTWFRFQPLSHATSPLARAPQYPQ